MNILVDTGMGFRRQLQFIEPHDAGGSRLTSNLRSTALTARDIHMVILTNLRFDHSGGSTKLDRAGNVVPVFPRARYLVQRDCWEEAKSPNERWEAFYYPNDLLPLEEGGLLELLDGDAHAAEGVKVEVTGGPTEAHQIVLVEQGSQVIAFLGDLIPTAYHLRLDYISSWDEHPNRTLVQKQRVLDRASQEGWLVVFGHGHGYRAGHIQQQDGSFRLSPVEM